MSGLIATMWEEKKYGQLGTVALVVVALGGTISLNLPYPKTEHVKQSHRAIIHNISRDELVEKLKDNRKWLSYYQSQIALMGELAAAQEVGLSESQRAILNSLEREQSLIITSRKELMDQLENGGYAHDPLHDDATL